MIILALSRPEVLEKALFIKMIGVEEMTAIREAWYDIKLMIVHDIKATRGHSNLELLNSCVPEFNMAQHREVPCVAIINKGPHEEFASALALQCGAHQTSSMNYKGVDLKAAYKARPQAMTPTRPDCVSCQKPAYLGRCRNCVRPLHQACGRVKEYQLGLVCPDCRM